MNNLKTTDVCINVYGKPYQTLLTLKDLLKFNKEYIDKIYLIEEAKQPYNETFDINFFKEHLKYDNIIHFKPAYHLYVLPCTDYERAFVDKDYRLSLRYQYAIENTDKKYLLIMHNDLRIFSLLVPDFLNEINEDNTVGGGILGQCWNCPLGPQRENLCSRETCHNVKLDYDVIMECVNKYPNTRSYIHRTKIDKKYPMPMLECRLNEFLCLINIDLYRQVAMPWGNIFPFGGYSSDGIDIADVCYRQFVLNGYKFKNINIFKYCLHGPAANHVESGHAALFNQSKYINEENITKTILQNEYNCKFN